MKTKNYQMLSKKEMLDINVGGIPCLCILPWIVILLGGDN